MMRPEAECESGRPTTVTTLPTVCESCAGPIPVPYRWLGATADCPHCLRATVPVLADGTEYPPTGHELSFGGFVQLLRSGDSSVREFLGAYGYSLDSSKEARPRVLNEHDESVDISWLHDRIQDDVPRRQEIYGIAMLLWR